MYDYQAMCKLQNHHPSTARPLVSVSVTPDLSSTRRQAPCCPKMRSLGPCSHPASGHLALSDFFLPPCSLHLAFSHPRSRGVIFRASGELFWQLMK